MSNAMQPYHDMIDRLTSSNLMWLSDIDDNCPEFFGYGYSNPYFTAPPKGWTESRNRILVVGEEGNGIWGMNKGIITPDYIERLQMYNWEILATNVYPDDVQDYELFPDAEYDDYNRSAFWRRMRQVAQYGVCAWTNQDRFHHLKRSGCGLSDQERDRLHSVECRLLQREIRILDPTHVFFFGFYRRSVSHELPEVFDLLQPGGYEDRSRWFKNVVDIPYEGRHYIFSYHPGWRGRPEGYEERVMEVFKASLA